MMIWPPVLRWTRCGVQWAMMLRYSMPGMDGYAGLSRALSIAGETPVALMSGTAPPDAALACLDLGGAGFIPKNYVCAVLSQRRSVYGGR